MMWSNLFAYITNRSPEPPQNPAGFRITPDRCDVEGVCQEVGAAIVGGVR